MAETRTMTRICTKCRKRKLLADFSPHPKTKDRVEHQCKRCRANARRLNPPPTRLYCIDCGKRVRRCDRCMACQAKHQAEVEAIAPPRKPGEKFCGLPVMGGWCSHAVQFGVNRDGFTVMWCVVHGERLMPRIGKIEYPQRPDMEANLERRLQISTSPAKPHVQWKQKHPFNKRKYGLKKSA